MNERERVEIIRTARECSRTLEQMVPRIFEVGENLASVRRLLRLYNEVAGLWEGLPEGWDGQARGMLVTGEVAGNRGNLATFLRSNEDRLSPAEVSMARLWEGAPWHYAAYMVAEELGDNLFHIDELEISPAGRPEHAGPSSLLFSPSTGEYMREGGRLFFTLLFWNGRCFQTYGPIVSSRSLEVDDLAFFVREVAAARHRASDRDEGLSIVRIAAADPIPFIALYRYSEVPPLISRNEPLVYCNGWADVGEVDFGRIAETAGASAESVKEAAQVEGVGRILFGKADEMHDPIAYFDGERKRVHVVAMTDRAYARARTALVPIAPLPKVPQRRCTIIMHVAASEILGGESDADRLAEACSSLDTRRRGRKKKTG